MHELSLALDVCRIAEDHVGADRLGDVVEVGLEVGERAGVEIANLEFCLEALLAAPPFGRGRPAVTRTPDDELRVTYVEVDDGGAPD